MRDIKFRAWVKEHIDSETYEYSPIMVYNIQNVYDGRVYTKDNKEYEVASAFCSFLNNKDWYETMQYTGKKDKNGIEIYEGDIVRKVDTNALGYARERICTIEYDEDWSAFKVLTTFGDGYELGVFDNEQLEVIGNIWENPELLDK